MVVEMQKQVLRCSETTKKGLRKKEPWYNLSDNSHGKQALYTCKVNHFLWFYRDKHHSTRYIWDTHFYVVYFHSATAVSVQAVNKRGKGERKKEKNEIISIVKHATSTKWYRNLNLPSTTVRCVQHSISLSCNRLVHSRIMEPRRKKNRKNQFHFA